MDTFPQQYKALKNQEYTSDIYSIVPIRYVDRINIMNWRNAQIFHLRQKEPLTLDQQDFYFNTVVKSLFEVDQPNQILFSYLENGKCIGYGGLVHIDWLSKNAEISFIIDPSLEKSYFSKHWGIYLDLIEKAAFEGLFFNKIYTYAFDLRPYLYPIIEAKGYRKEAVLKDHYFFNNNFYDVLIHSKLRSEANVIYLQEAREQDAMLLYYWTNDADARVNSLSRDPISVETHLLWFKNKLKDKSAKIFILVNKKIPIGTIRIQREENFWNISYFVDKNFRGQKLGLRIVDLLINEYPQYNYKAIVKKTNRPSNKVFEKLNFSLIENNDNDLNTYTKTTL